MKLMKVMLSAMLLSLSLGAYAQDDDELLDAAGEDSTEVFVPSTPSEAKFFHRVQLGFAGTSAKYTNNSAQRSPTAPASEKYFLKGVTFGWMGDLSLTKRMPLYLELGAMMTYLSGSNDGYTINRRSQLNGDGAVLSYEQSVKAFTLAIPIGLTYQFKNVGGVKDLTVAPLAGVYARFNLVAKRKETKTEVVYGESVMGQDVMTEYNVTTQNKSLMKYTEDGGWMEGRSHVGKLCQPGVMVGVNAFYKHYSFGFSYMYDLIPFAQHNSPLGLTSQSTPQGGNLPSSGTGCDMKISTKHNFAITVGYIF
jgi:hypothetical protein